MVRCTLARGRYRCFIIALPLAAWSRPAHALDDSDKEAIRSLSNQAASDYEWRKYEAARQKFHRAYAIAKVPKLAVWEARADEKLGRLVTAYELYRQALGLEPNDLWKGTVQQQAQKDAQEELTKLQPRLQRVTITIEGANANDGSVKVDDVQVPSALIGVERYVDPGQRRIVATCGSETVTEAVAVAVAEGKNKPQPARSFSLHRTASIARLGASLGDFAFMPSGCGRVCTRRQHASELRNSKTIRE